MSASPINQRGWAVGDDASAVRPEPHAHTIPLDVRWSALVARGDSGRSTNALALDGSGSDVASSGAPATGSTRAPDANWTRRIDLHVEIRETDDHAMLVAWLASDTERRELTADGPIRVELVCAGGHVHIETPSDPGLFTAVFGGDGRVLMVRSRLPELSGLPAGAFAPPTCRRPGDADV